MLEPNLEQLLLDASANNVEAFRFLKGCHYLWHGIDDVLDGEVPAETIKETIINLFVYSKDLYSCPFYREHCDKLSGVIDAIANAYADSIVYENNDQTQQHIDHERHQKTSDIIRSQGVDIICIVAKICGGYQHMRDISDRARKLSYDSQH